MVICCLHCWYLSCLRFFPIFPFSILPHRVCLWRLTRDMLVFELNTAGVLGIKVRRLSLSCALFSVSVVDLPTQPVAWNRTHSSLNRVLQPTGEDHEGLRSLWKGRTERAASGYCHRPPAQGRELVGSDLSSCKNNYLRIYLPIYQRKRG